MVAKRTTAGLHRPRGFSPQRITISLSDRADLALFVQIRERIRELIIQGTLTPGMRLPPVRAFAQQLKVNQLTVAKAYGDLAKEGLIEGRRGGGSFVRDLPLAPRIGTDQTPNPTQPMLAERLYELARAPGVIAFSSNYPQLDQLSIGGFQESLQTVIATKLDDCMHYEPPAGRLELRRQICLVLASQGIVADEDEIIITSGAQQGIDLAIRMLCQAGTSVAIERPAYYGAINAFRCAQTRILEVPLTDDGMDLDVLQKYLESNGARLIYTNPTFHNPTGVTTSAAKRRALLALAKRYDAIILEDDHSSELRFSGEPVPAIRCLDENGDNVIYVRSFGKTFLPGVRLGFLAVPSTLRQRLLFTKASADLHCNGLLQEAVAEHLRHGRHLVALDRLRETYAGHQSVLRAAITAGLPEEASLSSPSGGLSFWLTLPKRADTSELYFSAVRRGVSFVDGDAFYASRSNERSIRVSFGLSKPSELLEGADRLCAAIKDLLTTRRTRDLAMT